jgi:hypothetical protein
MPEIITRSLAALLAMGLAACGGGGGGGVSPPPVTFNLQAGHNSLIAMGQVGTATLSGNASNGTTVVPFTGSGTVQLSPGAPAMFANLNVTSQTLSFSGTVMVAGQSSAVSASVTDYYDGTGALLAEDAGNEYDLTTAPITFPSMVMAGSNGILGTLARYTDSTLSTPIGSMQLSYTCPTAPVSGALPVLITTKYYDPQNVLVETDVYKYLLTSVSTMLLTSLSYQGNPDTLLLTLP